MIDGLSGLGQFSPRLSAVNSQASDKVKTEFLTIFYKEMLKQVFKTPDLSLGGEEEKGNNIISTFNSDLMAEKLAEVMAKNALSSQQWVMPAEGAE